MPFNPTPSSSAPNLITPTSLFTPTTDSSLPSISSLQFSSATLDTQLNTNGLEQESPPTTPNQTLDVDPQILEALRSKDRIYVLKLGELMEGLINDESRENIALNPTTSYQRLLVHRCSAYYKLIPESDPASKGIIVISTIESRIPSRKLCDLIPAEATAQPAFKIMRRSLQERRPNKSQSQAGSVTGEDADLSDVEPSESGSLGGRSNVTGGSNKKRMTIEEREAAYNEARSRIFMGFEEKEKEKDMSASSSSLSLVSLSLSTSGRGGSSSADEPDDSASSPATESEWSGPSGIHTRDKKDGRHMTSSSSSRSLRPSAPAFNSNGSSRNSRAPSPSFTYATIYEPPPGPTYDPSQHPPHPGYTAPHYLYPYSPHGQPQNPYLPPYPYYTPYGPYPPPPPQQSVSDPSTPANAEMYPPPPHVGYAQAYGWSHPQHAPLQSPPQMPQHHSQLSSQPPHHPNHAVIPSPPVHNPQYQPYVPPSQPYPYPTPGYYTPTPAQHMESGSPHVNAQSVYDVPRSTNGVMGHQNNGYGTHTMSRNGGINNSNSNGRTPIRNGVVNGGNKTRGPPLTQARSAWSYGPGIGMGGFVTPGGPISGEAIGPRLSSTRRHPSNSGSANSRSSNCDDVSSTASSSTTSSSSRRTYTSTTSSQHPLPPRPDWAVGLKPQPTLHPTQVRHQDQSNSRTMSPISASRHLNGGPQHPGTSMHQPSTQSPSTTLQSSTDFPPLTSLPVAPEKRTPVVTGAWGNSATRAIRLPSPGHPNSPTNALLQHPSSTGGNRGTQEIRLEEPDRGFERPPPKSAELYNPKLLRRPTNSRVTGEKEKERVRGETIANAILVGQVEAMSMEDQALGSASVAIPHTDSVSAWAT
ncbi:hypothetical protein BDZ94DRAFT_1221785 [Collybia nuda]|uniref:SUZ domain-containing protein n=1 Tax=Collybia nuda TaxID=64659 RepID=A0A9P5Y453_9AGAR|nr:hypothetical protein BDZ94DRAFT_1221785 [Collybia nuda]